MFAFEVEYLLGRVFAGDFRDRSESEWPPHPARLFSALAAAHFEAGENGAEREALEWLETQPVPHLFAAAPGEPDKTVAFVPTNYPGDGPPAVRGKQPRVFPAQGPAQATAYFIWPDSEPPSGIRERLEELAARTGYLGKACSLVRISVSENPPEANYLPDPTGDHVLRVPSQGRLSELRWLFSVNRRPSPGAQQRYSRRSDAPDQKPVVSEFGQMLAFRKTAGPGLPIEGALTLTDAARSALMSIAGRNGPIPDLIQGHAGRTHCAYIALPVVGHQHADGHLLGFAIVLPRNVELRDRRTVLFACGVLQETGLNIPGVGLWKLEAVESTPPVAALRTATWTQPAYRWSTVTPILLDRFPKKKGPSAEQILGAACARIGLPEPVEIEHSPFSRLEGVPPVPQFRLLRKNDTRPRWGVHATLTFSRPVSGPVLLGAGRYFGLGLLRPVDRKEPLADDQR